MNIYFKTIILGCLVGFIGGLQGHAGSIYIVTGLLLFGIVKTQAEAAGIALIYTSIPLTIFAAYQYYLNHDINLSLCLPLIISAIIFSIIGAKFNPLIPKKYVSYSIAISLVLSSIYFFLRANRE